MHIRECPAWWVTSRMYYTINQMPDIIIRMWGYAVMSLKQEPDASNSSLSVTPTIIVPDPIMNDMPLYILVGGFLLH